MIPPDFDARGRVSRMLKQRRDDLGMSQRELATVAGTSGPSISQYEGGRYSPALDSFVRLCFALEVSPNELLMWDQEDVDLDDADGDPETDQEDAPPRDRGVSASMNGSGEILEDNERLARRIRAWLSDMLIINGQEMTTARAVADRLAMNDEADRVARVLEAMADQQDDVVKRDGAFALVDGEGSVRA